MFLPRLIEPYARVDIFHIAKYLRSLETYVHKQTNEIVMEWLLIEGVEKGPLNQMLYKYLRAQGYTGTINDMMKEWREAG